MVLPGRSLLPLLTLAIALALPPAAQGAQETLVVGDSIARIGLGFTRDQVVALEGSPVSENQNGYMEYRPLAANGLFDVYLDVAATPPTVRMIGVSGGDIVTPEGIHVFKKGALRRLKRAYPGMRLRRADTDTDEKLYRIATHDGQGRRVWTDFTPADARPTLSSRVIMVFLLYPTG